MGGPDGGGLRLAAFCRFDAYLERLLIMVRRGWPLRRAGITGAGPAARPGAHALLVVLPFAVMAAVTAVDMLAGPAVGFMPLLSLGPALAAVSLRPGHTALTGGLAGLLCLALIIYDTLGTHRRGVIALATIAGVTAAGAVASAARHRREEQLANVTVVAEAAQRVLLRPVPPRAGPVLAAVRYVSAAAAARIGGDLYEIISTPGKVRIIVGDVQGKGLAAVNTAAAVLGAFREAAHDAPDLAALAARLELSLCREATDEEFVTAILAEISGNGASAELLSCGHPPPLLLNGTAARFAGPPEAGLPLGLAGLAEPGHVPYRVTLEPGDRLLFYTDGISEARDRSGSFYPLSACGALLAGLSPDAALDRLCADVLRHVGHDLADDAAILLIARSPDGPEPGDGQVTSASAPAGSKPRVPAAAGCGGAAAGTARPAHPQSTAAGRGFAGGRHPAGRQPPR